MSKATDIDSVTGNSIINTSEHGSPAIIPNTETLTRKDDEEKDVSSNDNYMAYTLSEQMLTRVKERLSDKEKRNELNWFRRHDIKKQVRILQKKLARIKPDTITDAEATELLIQREVLELTVREWLEK